jgi:hypothetical protein
VVFSLPPQCHDDRFKTSAHDQPATGHKNREHRVMESKNLTDIAEDVSYGVKYKAVIDEQWAGKDAGFI